MPTGPCIQANKALTKKTNAKYWMYKTIFFYSRFSNWERLFQVSSTSICKVTSEWLKEVTTATLLEVTSAISHSDPWSDSRREEMCHFGGTSRSHFGDTSRSDFAEVAHFFPTGVISAIRMRYRGRSFSSSRSHL